MEPDSTAVCAKDLRDAINGCSDDRDPVAAGYRHHPTNSTIYLEAAGHMVVAWMWLEQPMPPPATTMVTSTTQNALRHSTLRLRAAQGRPHSSNCG
jgi:hypothetical protein